MHGRQLRANHIRIAGRSAVLLPAECFEKPRLAKLIAPEALDPFAFLPGVHSNEEGISPSAQRLISAAW